MASPYDELLAAVHEARVETSEVCSQLLEALDELEALGDTAVLSSTEQQRRLVTRQQRMFLALASAAELLAVEVESVDEFRDMLADVVSQGLGG